MGAGESTSVLISSLKPKPKKKKIIIIMIIKIVMNI